MQQEHDNQAFHLLQNAYDEKCKRVLQSQNRFVERLGQVRRELDGMLEALRTDFQEGSVQDQLYYETLDKVRAISAATAPEEKKQNDDTVAHIESELFRTREALSASEERVKELQEQLQAGVSHNLNLYIDNLKSHLTKKNEIIDTARKRILRLQQKIEGMAYERMEALQHVADLNMRISSHTEAVANAEAQLAELQHKYNLKLSCMAAVNAQLEAMERRFSMTKHASDSLHSQSDRQTELRTYAGEDDSSPAAQELNARFSKQQEELEDANTLLELMQVDLNTCQRKIQEEEEMVRVLKEALTSAESETLQYKDKLRETEDANQALSGEKNSLEETLARFQEEMNLIRESLKIQEDKSRSLDEALHAASEEIEGYKERLLEKEEEVKALLRDKTLLTEEKERSKGALSDWAQKFSSVQTANEELSRLSDRLTRELHDLSDLLEQRTSEARELRQELDRVHQANQDSSELTQAVLEEQQRLLTEEKQRNEVMCLEIETANKALLQEREAASELKREMCARELELKTKYKEAADEIQSLKDMALQVGNDKEQVLLLTESLETERARAKEIQTSLTKALGGAESLKQDLSEAENRRVDAQREMEATSKILEALRNLHVQESERKECAEKEVQTLREEVKLKSEETETLSSRLEISLEELQEAGIALAETRAEIEKLRETVYEALLEKDAALLQVKDMKGKIQAFEKATKKVPSAKTLNALQEELAAERRRADMTQKLLDESLSGGTKGKLLQQLAEAKRECEVAREELKSLKAKHEAKN